MFAFVTYKNRKHRDQVNKKVSADPSMNVSMDTLPFDPRRMFWGGFKPLVEI